MINFSYISGDNQEKSIKLPIDQKTFDEIKHEVEGCSLEDLEYWEFWELRDFLFKTFVLEGFRDQLNSFFQKTLLNQFNFKPGQDRLEIKVVDVFYCFYYGDEIYLFSEPSEVVYPDHQIERIEARLKFNVEELELLLEQLLDSFEVKYASYKEEVGQMCFDELELGSFFGDLMFECWSRTKSEYNSKVIGMVSYASGGAGCLDLDNGARIEETDEGIKQYLAKRI